MVSKVTVNSHNCQVIFIKRYVWTFVLLFDIKKRCIKLTLISLTFFCYRNAAPFRAFMPKLTLIFFIYLPCLHAPPVVRCRLPFGSRLFGDLHANYSSLVRWSRVDFEKDPRFYFVSACRQYDRRVYYHLFNNFMLAARSGRSRSCGCCPAGCDSLQNSHRYQAFLAEQLCLSCAHLNRVPYKHMFIDSVHIHLLGDVK